MINEKMEKMEKMTNTSYIFIAIFCCLSVSCIKYGNRENNLLIQQAQELIEQQPDSALKLLDAVNTVKLSKAERMEYILQRVQARDNAEMDLSTDTEIFEAQKYFIRKKDSEKVALACFYAGVVLQSQEKDAEAMEFYLIADDFAQLTNNYQLRGRIQNRIGDANYMLGLIDDALSCYIHAIGFFRNANIWSSEIGSMIKIGNCYLLTARYDSAFTVYERAEKKAYSINDTALLLSVLQNKGVAFLQTGNLTTSTEIFHKALTLANRQDSANLFLNLAGIYLNSNLPDTAAVYGEKALAVINSSVDKSTVLYAYKIMLLVEAYRNNGDRIIDYFMRHNACLDEILEKREKESLLEVQRKYDFEKAQAEYKIEKRNYVIIALTVILLLILLLLYLSKEKIRNEKTIARLFIELDELREIEQKLKETEMSTKTAESETNRIEKSNQLKSINSEQSRKLIAQYFDILRNIVFECENASQKDTVEIDRLKRKVFGSSEYDFWTAAQKLIPKGLQKKIEKICPELDKTEVKICCLTYIDADVTAIATALGMKGSSIHTMNTNIRKKIGKGKGESIKLYFEEKLHKIS